MFNLKKKEESMTDEKKVWLVIEKNNYGSSTSSYSVVKNHVSLDEAMRYKVCLEKLNDRKSQSYFLASDVDTILESVAFHHNKSVENGSYYKNHPEIKRPEKKEVEEEISF